MKFQHELSPEARQAALAVHHAVHDAGRMIAAGLALLGVCLVVAALIRRGKGV